MSVETFIWQPLLNPVGQTTYRVRKAQFGDGYSQTVGDGINNAVSSWPLSFRGRSAQITPVKAFLDAHAGFVSFYWTPPLGVQGLYRCESSTLQFMGVDMYTLTATFEQVFAP
jgi:phage-related protein